MNPITEVTATELKINLGKYLEMAEKTDIVVTRNGKAVAKLTTPYKTRTDKIKALFGVLPSSVDDKEVKEGRIRR